MATRTLKQQLLLLLLLLAVLLSDADVRGQPSSAPGSLSASTSVGYCDEEDVDKWVTSSLLTQCGEDANYSFSSGVKPTLEQAQAFCGSSCFSLFQLGLTSSDECRLPFGDHIYLIADLIEYVLDVCANTDASASSAGSSGDAEPVASSSSGSEEGGSSTIPIAIGVGAGAVVLLALLAWLCWRRLRQRHKRDLTNDSDLSQEGYMPMLSEVDGQQCSSGLLIAESADTSGYRSHTASTTMTGSTTSSLSMSLSHKKKRPRLSDLTPWRVDVDSIQDIERLGHGAHGVVWRVMYRGTTVLASKRIQTDQVSQKHTQDFIDEILLLSHLQHPNIVAFVGVAWTMESDLQVLLEFMDAGDLRGYLLKPNTPKTWTLQKLSIAHDIVQALVYVHSFQPPLLHRDLKSQNVMLTIGSGNKNNPRATMVTTPLTAKLTDFGISRFHSENNTMTIGVGTSRWLAPEVILGQSNYGPETDIYSFGVVLSELDTHELPYNDTRTEDGDPLPNVAILQLVAMGETKPTFRTESCPPELLSLAYQCLEHDGSKRPTAPQMAYELRKLMRAMATD